MCSPGRSRTQVNRKTGQRAQGPGRGRALHHFLARRPGAGRAGGRGLRRELLDDALGLVDAEGARAADEVDRVLRQRAALLRQAGGRVERRRGQHPRRLGPAPGRCGKDPGHRRANAWSAPSTSSWARPTAGWPACPDQVVVSQHYRPQLDRGAARRLGGTPDGRPATGRQHGGAPPRRSRADAGRARGPHPRLPGRAALPGPGACGSGSTSSSWREPASTPILLLDDVFSELDPARSRALVAELPPGQSILTTAGPAARGIDGGPDRRHRPGGAGAVSADRRRRPSGPDAGPQQVGEAIAKVLSRIGASPSPQTMELVFTRWEELVGAELARAFTADAPAGFHPGGRGRPPGLGHPGPHGLRRDPDPRRQLGDTTIERIEVVVQRSLNGPPRWPRKAPK